MNRSCFALATAALLLSSCDAFVPPKVDCDTITVAAGGTYQEHQPNQGCVIAEDDVAIISHNPHASADDPQSSQANSDFDQQVPNDTSLPSLKVNVVGAAGFFVCPGDNCTPTAPSASVTIDDHGTLTYTLGTSWQMVLAGGGEYSETGTIATEAYSPGNACFVTEVVDFKCTAYTQQSSSSQ